MSAAVSLDRGSDIFACRWGSVGGVPQSLVHCLASSRCKYAGMHRSQSDRNSFFLESRFRLFLLHIATHEKYSLIGNVVVCTSVEYAKEKVRSPIAVFENWVNVRVSKAQAWSPPFPPSISKLHMIVLASVVIQRSHFDL